MKPGGRHGSARPPRGRRDRGHLVPGLTLANALLARGDRVALARPGELVEDRFPVPAGLERFRLAVPKGRLGLALSLPRAVMRATRLLDELGADLLVGLGGYGSLPALLAARRRRVPVVLLEQNLVLGKANRVGLRFARRVYTAFPDTAPVPERRLDDRFRGLGMPLRPGRPCARDPLLRQRLGIAPDKRIVLVLGGSQGASSLNRAVPPFLATLPAELRGTLAVLHAAGPGKEGECAEAWRTTGIEAHVFPFLEDPAPFLALADVVLCRGGGTTLVEVAAAARPALVVPYPWHADRQQELNARWFEERGVFRVLAQDALMGTGEDRAAAGSWLADLLRDDGHRRELGRRAGTLLPRDATRRILDDLDVLLRGGRGTTRAVTEVAEA
ncbi:MAG: glycosyltransferase [Planctomycetota bacterium]